MNDTVPVFRKDNKDPVYVDIDKLRVDITSNIFIKCYEMFVYVSYNNQHNPEDRNYIKWHTVCEILGAKTLNYEKINTAIHVREFFREIKRVVDNLTSEQLEAKFKLYRL